MTHELGQSPRVASIAGVIGRVVLQWASGGDVAEPQASLLVQAHGVRGAFERLRRAASKAPTRTAVLIEIHRAAEDVSISRIEDAIGQAESIGLVGRIKARWRISTLRWKMRRQRSTLRRHLKRCDRQLLEARLSLRRKLAQEQNEVARAQIQTEAAFLFTRICTETWETVAPAVGADSELRRQLVELLRFNIRKLERAPQQSPERNPHLPHSPDSNSD